jgi:glycogen operon protein
MLLAGDELSHTQQGNNNAYCQDNELTWLNWNLTPEQQAFLEFVRMVVRLWETQPVLQRRKFFLGRKIRGSEIKDISFLDPTGQEMTDEAWNAGFVRSLGVRLAGDLIDDVDERGERITGDTLLLLLNAHYEPIPFLLPPQKAGQCWERLFDTVDPQAGAEILHGGQEYVLQGRAMAVFRTRPEDVADPARGSPAPTGQTAAPPAP